MTTTTDFKGRGPIPADVVIVGEAWGRQEAEKGKPFMGAAGKELTYWLAYAGMRDTIIRYTNVVNAQPWHSDFKSFCCSKREATQQYDPRQLPETSALIWPPGYNWKPVASGKYLRPDMLPHLALLYEEIDACQPRLIIPVGNTACWAILGHTGIGKFRGSVTWSDRFNCKVMPTLHPAAILRNYEHQPLAIVDMLKAKRELETDTIIRPEREIWLDPDLTDLQNFDAKIRSATYIGCDIETEIKGGFVTMVGFSVDEHTAICIPFYDPRVADKNYWATPEHEYEAWSYVEAWLHADAPKVFQNGSFDMSWLWAVHGMYPNDWEDTLLQAHAIQPELPKDLGTLGSIFTNERNWKTSIRHKTSKDNE